MELISEQIADFILASDCASLPEGVRAVARRSLLDWTGSALRGSGEPPARMMTDLARAEGGRPRATALPDGWKTSVEWATRINAVASHTVEMDDLHPSSVLHPGAPVMSAAVAMAEALDSTGTELVEAIAVGYEVAVRAGEAAGPDHYRLWHTTGTCGTFGAAAAAAKLLKLDRRAIIDALGSAGTQAAGLWQFLADGAMSKQLHPAHAAGAGIHAAELARRGFTAAQEIFEGEKGFLRAMSPNPDPDRLTEGLGSEYRMVDNAFKKHAACRHTHSAIDAALLVRDRTSLTPEDIDEISVHVYPAADDLLRDVEPTTPYAAKFSLPYTIAVAVCRGHVDLADFVDVTAEDIGSVIEKVRVVRDDALGDEYPVKWPSRVEIRFRDGTRANAEIDYPRGDARNPLTNDELEKKFRTLTSTILRTEQQDHIVSASMTVEAIDVRSFWPF